MSQFSGKQFKGAMRLRRQLKREQAVARNAATQPERRRPFRRQASKAA
jgi:hypothetical protein